MSAKSEAIQPEKSVPPVVPADQIPVPPDQQTTHTPFVFPAIMGALLIIAGYLGYRYYVLSQPEPKPVEIAPTATPTMTPTPTPTPYPLPQGEQVYNVSMSADAKGPKIIQVKVNPFDPKMGIAQTYTVMTKSSVPVKSIEMELTTDKKKTPYTLKQIGGSDTNGVWAITITTDDTHFYVYEPSFTIKDTSDQSNEYDLTFRAY